MPHPPIAVPEVGGDEISKIQDTEKGFAEAANDIKDYDPETIVIISPHSPLLNDAFYMAKGSRCEGNLSKFNAPTPSYSYSYDTEISDEIARLCKEEGIPLVYSDYDAGTLDHGITVPLYYVNHAYSAKIPPYRIVRIAPSFLPDEDHIRMGGVIERAIAHIGRRAVIIASGDLSHKLKEDGPYGFIKEGPLFDKAITDVMKSGKLEDMMCIDRKVNDLSANCGYPGFVMLCGALKNYRITPRFLSYECTFGVGYGICIFGCENWYTRLAKASLESYVTTGKTLGEEDTREYPETFRNNRAGVFVCIKKHGELRGCIGTIMPTRECILDETCELAISAGMHDPRFPEVTAAELPELCYTVDIMGEPERATVDQLDEKRYGVIVTKGMRRGLLLPNLEGVDSVEEQLDISCRKGGISPSEDYEIERFTVERQS